MTLIESINSVEKEWLLGYLENLPLVLMQTDLGEKFIKRREDLLRRVIEKSSKCQKFTNYEIADLFMSSSESEIRDQLFYRAIPSYIDKEILFLTSRNNFYHKLFSICNNEVDFYTALKKTYFSKELLSEDLNIVFGSDRGLYKAFLEGVVADENININNYIKAIKDSQEKVTKEISKRVFLSS